ncbi:MAG: hypothetical protein RI885_2343 [Actinomycetota bacterium]|jgi:hypothetical protein
MRGFTSLNTANGDVNLGDLEFIPAGHRVGIKAADSVETAVLNVQVAGLNVFSGTLPVEPSTNGVYAWTNLLTTFVVKDRSQMRVTLSGTLAGCRVDIIVLAPGEPAPWD